MTERLAVLVVNPDAEILDAQRKAIRARGMAPIVCLGPDRSTGCPLLDGLDCPLRDQADAIILELDLEIPDHLRALDEYIKNDRPKMVVVSPKERLRWSRLSGKQTSLGGPADVEGFLDEFRARKDGEGAT